MSFIVSLTKINVNNEQNELKKCKDLSFGVTLRKISVKDEQNKLKMCNFLSFIVSLSKIRENMNKMNYKWLIFCHLL